jgi:3-hydroxybutyryl-CoA dehydrogenase
MNQIGILGAGLMGHGLAQVFAAAGCQVSVFDHNAGTLSSLKNRVRQNLDVLEQEALVSKEAADLCLDRIVLSDSLDAMCRGRDFILEAISENLAAKRLAFSEMEGHVPPETILASNTSAIRITEIARGLRYPQRLLGTHFWNPPHIVPCVEVVKAAETSNASFEAAFRLMEKVGKIPVRVLKDIPGFLGNRMQHALWREAFSLVEQGIASAEDVDKVVRNAFGLRLAFLGPLETADLAGLELTHHIQQDLLPRLEASPTPSALLKEKVDRGSLGAISGEGFHRWPAEKLKRLIERRDRILLGIANLVRSG